MPIPRAYVFDAYGTLLDVHSVLQRAAATIPGDLNALSQLWRRKQLEYTWLRALMGRYDDFQAVTEAALRASAQELAIPIADSQVAQLMQAYLHPAAFDDARPALEALKSHPLAILSNGTPAMLDAAFQHNGLARYFTAIISVDRIKTYKPSPRVYALGPDALHLPAPEILFVSSNFWDAAGAKSFGYQVCWCNRSAAPMENLGFTPDLTIHSLDELVK
jgi:2-haloacid dehalogenase